MTLAPDISIITPGAGRPRLSVVVPFHDVEEYLDACLSSLSLQTSAAFTEVILVDDGSTDGSARIAREWADRDPLFRLVAQDHSGPGSARNTGVALARGEYLAFADGDDLVPPDAYERLLGTLERTGSDLVSGAVHRVGSFGTKPSHLHGRAIQGELLGTHISRTPSLLYDVTMWNKVIRRSFWDAHGLRFPEGVLYEDIRLATRLHCLARSVDVIDEPIYQWRERSGGNPSITQERGTSANLSDRIGALLAIDADLSACSPRRLRREHHRKVLTNDLPLYFRELQRAGDGYRTMFLDLANGYLDRVPSRLYTALPARDRLKFHLIRTRRMADLLELLAWERTVKPGATPVVRERLRLHADLPFRDDPSIPRRVFRLSVAETAPVTRVVPVPRRPVIETREWTDGGVLVLTGSHPDLRPLEAVLRRRGTGHRHSFPFVQDGGRFEVRMPLRAATSFGRTAPLLDGTWDLTVRPVDGHGPGPSAFDHSRLPASGEETVVHDAKRFRFLCPRSGDPVVEVSADSAADVRGACAQRRIQAGFYPRQRSLGLRDQVTFVSWKGKQCSDNPRAIADELRRMGDDREHVWVVRDTATEAPEGATVVRQWSHAYYEALARSRFVVANDDMPASYVKSEGQTYLQTWHGTPLKKIGFDIREIRFASGGAYLDHLADDVAKWDLMLSPNAYSTPILRRAFRYEGEILESGYPRNDVLHSPGAAARAAAVRERLGVPAGRRVVLYAPTWRDDLFYEGGRYRFDARLDLVRAREALGDGTVVLIRSHHLIADDLYDPAYGDFVVNVTAYPDISDLYLISDVLITDYSSAMFDFAGTGRPMLFFTYDLDTYRDHLRGFYFDFAAQAPGPLLATSDAVIEALGDLGSVAAGYEPARARFAEAFHPAVPRSSAAVAARLL
ncbi:bifunctional glycosyltransferase/CDP-glycerol:glycerophosphate glycerophosphotransferase [Actinocorallia longicatena]|uniref:Glycosyltransferase 2-like domain-containing protein n=1 Tax=Actinocorallia longicatena TaxID=111803 RepID=A0ABP6QA47_9ACTN